MFAEFPEEAGAQLDVATQKDARERLERHGANPFTVFDEDERFAIGFEFDISAVDIEAGHGRGAIQRIMKAP